jgi:hypothetical protein
MNRAETQDLIARLERPDADLFHMQSVALNGLGFETAHHKGGPRWRPEPSGSWQARPSPLTSVDDALHVLEHVGLCVLTINARPPIPGLSGYNAGISICGEVMAFYGHHPVMAAAVTLAALRLRLSGMIA